MVSEAEWETIALERSAEHGWEPLHGSADRAGHRRRTDVLGRSRAARAAARGDAPAQPARAGRVPGAGARRDRRADSRRTRSRRTTGCTRSSSTATAGSATSTPTAIEQNPTIRLVSHGVDENELARGQPGDRPVDGDRAPLRHRALPATACRWSIVELKKAGAEARRPRVGARPAADVPARVPDGVPLLRAHRSSATASPPGTARRSRRSTTSRRGTSTTTGVRVKPGADVADDRLGVELEYLIDGVCNQERFLQLQRNFIAFDEGADGLAKRIAKPHQYFAVTKAVGTHGRGGREQRQGRRRLAHPGLGQVDGDGALRPPGRAPAEAEEPDARRRHRPHRARQPALRDVQPLAGCCPRSPIQVTHARRSCATS